MKTLVYGAGVLGSVMAYNLKSAGEDVSILARGERYEYIKNNGIVLVNFWTNEQTSTDINVVNELKDEDNYDLIIVLMPRTSTTSILPILNNNKNAKHILFIGNNTNGFDEYSKVIDESRILLGFWLASGYRENQIVYYSDSNEKGEKSTLVFGEKNGNQSERCTEIKSIMNKAGIPVELSENIDAWLKSHAMLISPMAIGYYINDCDRQNLLKSKHTIKMMSKGIKEGISALKKLNIPILPKNLGIIRMLPLFLLNNKYKSMLNSKFFDIAFGHAKASQDEMELLFNECYEIIQKSGIKSSGYDTLLERKKSWYYKSHRVNCRVYYE